MKLSTLGLWLLALLLLLASIATIVYVPLVQWADELAVWIPAHYAIGLTAYVLILVVWALLVPTMVPIILAGYFFGFWVGVGAVYCATTSAFMISFFMTRKLFAQPFQRWLEHKPRSRLFINSLEGAGWRLVVWMRISPIIPFHIQNYCYGASKMSFATCLWATLVGKSLGICMTVLLGVVARSSADGIRGIDAAKDAWWWHAMMILAGIAACYVSYLIVHAAKKAIQQQGDMENAQD